LKKIKLVKYDYDSFPEDWKKSHANEFVGFVFAVLGKVDKMPGHVYCQEIKSGKPFILHEESLLALTKEEI
jgi:hypothetical protein